MNIPHKVEITAGEIVIYIDTFTVHSRQEV